MNVMDQKANNNQRVYGCTFKVREGNYINSMLALFNNADAMLDFAEALRQHNADVMWYGKTEMNRSSNDAITSLEKFENS